MKMARQLGAEPIVIVAKSVFSGPSAFVILSEAKDLCI